jgi:hypothetical protein
MATDPQELTTLAGCFNSLNPDQLFAIQTYLLAIMAGTSTDPAVLLAAASCFSCLNSNQLAAIQTYLLTQITGGGGGGGSTEVYALAGSSSPAAVPTAGGIAYNADGSVWVYSAGSWVLTLSA